MYIGNSWSGLYSPRSSSSGFVPRSSVPIDTAVPRNDATDAWSDGVLQDWLYACEFDSFHLVLHMMRGRRILAPARRVRFTAWHRFCPAILLQPF